MITTYDFKKQVAHALKSNTIGHFYDIDTEPPDVYAERFCKYFMRKILASDGEAQACVPQHAKTGAERVGSAATSSPAGVLSTPPLDLLMPDAWSAPSGSSTAPPRPPDPPYAARGGVNLDLLSDATFEANSILGGAPVARGGTGCPDLLSLGADTQGTSRSADTRAAPGQAAMSLDLLA